MKILLLNHSDTGGGAAVAVLRLLHSLRAQGVDVQLGVIEKRTSEPDVICFRKKINLFDLFKKILNKFYFACRPYLFSTTNPILHSENKITALDIHNINNSDYDLIHLHWVNYNTIAIEDFVKINKPIVWTMHDSWVFCGAEHHPNILEDDTRYITGYAGENKPSTTLGLDICRRVWERKQKHWRRLNCSFIAPSRYMKKCFRRSALFRDLANNCAVIPNIVPADVFRPLNKQNLRQKYRILSAKKVIGFGAFGITDKKSIKGGHLLLSALQKIKDIEDYQLVVFGNADNSLRGKFPVKTFFAGYVAEQNKLAELYNLCDVFVCPSVIESFGLTCLEASFCGVPVAAFRTGGVPDIVEHKKTGYLARPFVPDDLLTGILYCLENRKKISAEISRKTREDFKSSDIVRRHVDLYKKIIRQG